MHASLTKHTCNTQKIKLKPRLIASYDIRMWKRSGTFLVEREGMKSNEIHEA